MRLRPAGVGVWALALVAIAVAAFLVGRSGASSSEIVSLQAADGPRQMHVPKLTAVAPLPHLHKPPRREPSADENAVPETGGDGEEEPETYSESETPSELETYSPAPEEATSAPEENAPSTHEEPAAPVEEHAGAPAETTHTGGEELVPEG